MGFLFFFKFSILWDGLRHGVEKVKKKKTKTKKVVALFSITQQCLIFSLSFVIFVCTYESFVNLWWYARFGIWVYVSSNFKMLVSFWFCFACRLPFSFFCLKVFFVCFGTMYNNCITWAGTWTSCYIDIIYEYKNMFSLWRKF